MFLDSGFDLLTRAFFWPVVQEKPRKGKKCLGLDSGCRKIPDLGPDPARSLLPTQAFLTRIPAPIFFSTRASSDAQARMLTSIIFNDSSLKNFS